MSTPITEPGWYRAGPKGLERVCGLDEDPAEPWDLVKVEVDGEAAEVPLW